MGQGHIIGVGKGQGKKIGREANHRIAVARKGNPQL